MLSEKQLTARSKGGKAKAEKIYNQYLANPNICLYCKNPILKNNNQKLSDVKLKKFCNHSCSAKYNNKFRKKWNQCKICKTQISKPRNRCNNCLTKYVSKIGNTTKGESTPEKIRGNARYVYKKTYKKVVCFKCSYKKFIEVCHIKPVKTFDNSTPIHVINRLDNLVQLCPNCHWEFDNNLITIKPTTK